MSEMVIKESIAGTRIIRGNSRLPIRYPEGRICATEGCDTVLSVYNRRPNCQKHAPIRFPRVRGVQSAES